MRRINIAKQCQHIILLSTIFFTRFISNVPNNFRAHRIYRRTTSLLTRQRQLRTRHLRQLVLLRLWIITRLTRVNTQLLLNHIQSYENFTRFADVKLADGSMMKMPSEEKMIKEF